MSKVRWQVLMNAWGFSLNEDTYLSLRSAYSEKHRAYHTFEHIEACLHHLDGCAQEVVHPHELELAIWFHDAIYKIRSSTNEVDSAKWAMSFLQRNGAQQQQLKRVEDLILATVHSDAVHTGDLSLMVDIDLSILGAAPRVYDQFEAAVRKEYRYLPGFLFRRGRKKLLENFLARDTIFRNESFFKRFEHPARENLIRAIGLLS